MKTFYSLFLSLLSLLLCSCEKESFDADHLDVKAFVDLIIEGKYDPYAPLPAFKPEDIPALLKYANDFRHIPQFVINPISSLAIVDYKLGECILWTIEAIRQYDPASNDKIVYPS